MLTDSEESRAEMIGGCDGGGLSRSVLLAALDTLASLTDGILSPRQRGDLITARSRLASGTFNLAVLGEFKRGKSTLVNALLGRALLPTGVVPLTSVVTAIAQGPRERLVIHYADGRTSEEPVETLPRFVTEADNPRNRLGVELARLELDHELLRAGLELVDTPGVGSIHDHNTETAQAFLPRVDAALYVLDAGQPLSDAERQMLRAAAERIPRLLIIVNKIDHLDAQDRLAALDFVDSAVTTALDCPSTELFAVSARDGDGVPELRDRLLALASSERDQLLVRSVAALGCALAHSGAQAARFEAQAMQLPLQELGQRADEFDRRIVQLRAVGAEAGDLLEHGTERALEAVINVPLSSYARDHDAALRAQLHEQVAGVGPCSPRELAQLLHEWIDEQVRGTFADAVPRFESEISERIIELEARYAARVGGIIDEVHAVAQDVFGSAGGEGLPQTGMRAPSRFSFKLHDVENALDMIVGFGRTITPGALGRRLVVRDAEQRLIDMTDRHAGRLRSELADRVWAAVHEYRRELAAAVDDAIDSISEAVNRARADRHRGQSQAAARLDELALIASRCEEIACHIMPRQSALTRRDQREAS